MLVRLQIGPGLLAVPEHPELKAAQAMVPLSLSADGHPWPLGPVLAGTFGAAVVESVMEGRAAGYQAAGPYFECWLRSCQLEHCRL